jgi:histidyl-tRNA synthetase
VQGGESSQTPEHVGDVRAEDAAQHVQLVDDDQPEPAEERRPASVLGEDRLVDLLPTAFKDRVLGQKRLYVVPLGEAAQIEVLRLARDWTRAGVRLEVELTGRSLKAALKRADREGFRVVAIVGDDELAEAAIGAHDAQCATGLRQYTTWAMRGSTMSST